MGGHDPKDVGLKPEIRTQVEVAATTRSSELSRSLGTCRTPAQLEAIIYDDTLQFSPADVHAAFEALVRVCFHENSEPAVSGSSLLETALNADQPAPDHVEGFKSMGMVVLAHALDILHDLEHPHVSTILLALGLLGICVDDQIMLELVERAAATLQGCSGIDMVNVLAGLAMLEYQPDESSLSEFEKRVAALEAQSQFDTGARGSLLWSFTKLGREQDVQAAFDHTSAKIPLPVRRNARSVDPGKVKLKAIYLHSDDLRKTFHKRLQKCPLLMSRRKALPPKHVIVRKCLHDIRGKEIHADSCGKAGSPAGLPPRIERTSCLFTSLHAALGCGARTTFTGTSDGC